MSTAVAESVMEVDNVYTNATNSSKTAETEDKVSAPINAVVFSPELLQMYYSRLFPFSFLHQWLSYGKNTQVFSRREFSFTI